MKRSDQMYSQPSDVFLMEQLERAGADANGQIAGAIGITAALRGAAQPKYFDAKELDGLEKALRKTIGEYNRLDEQPKRWLNEEVLQQLERAQRAVQFAAQKRSSHAVFAEFLERHFETEGLKNTVSDYSPIVQIFGHCIGQDPNVARKTFDRLREQKG